MHQPRFPQGGAPPRFPAPNHGQQQQNRGPGWGREPWGQQRFQPPRQGFNQAQKSDTNHGQQQQNHGPGWGREPWGQQRFPQPRQGFNHRFPQPNNQCNTERPPPRPNMEGPQRHHGPKSPSGQSFKGPRFAPYHNSPPPNRHGKEPQNFQRQPGPNQGGFQRPSGPRPNGPMFRPDQNRAQSPQTGNFSPRPLGHQQSPNSPMFRPRHFNPPPRHGGGPPNFQRPPGQNGPHQQRPKFKGNFQQQQGPQSNKKQKVDKRELPENNRFYCDSCDRGFKDEDKFKIHTDSHEKCPEPGCVYVAAGKLVQLHLKLQHRAGLAKKIWSLESTEDIQKWRDERKKNFPTAENVAKKKALLAEKIARGEVIEEKYFGYTEKCIPHKWVKKALLAEKIARGEVIEEKYFGKMRGRGRGGRGNFQGRGRGRDGGRGRGRNQGDRQQPGDNKRKLPGEAGDDGAASCPQKQPKLASEGEAGATGDSAKMSLKDSLAVFFGAADNSDDDDSGMESDAGGETPSSRASPVTAAGALGSLMTSYQDSSSEEEEEEEEAEKDENKNNVSDTTPESKSALPEDKHTDTEAPTELQTSKKNTAIDEDDEPFTMDEPQYDIEDEDESNTLQEKQAAAGGRNKRRQRGRKKNKRGGGGGNNNRAEAMVDKTLLEKLLAKEIRQERNKILQCVHYIVKNRFFDDSTDKVEEKTSTDKVEEKTSTDKVEEKTSTDTIEEKTSTVKVEEKTSTDKMEESTASNKLEEKTSTVKVEEKAS